MKKNLLLFLSCALLFFSCNVIDDIIGGGETDSDTKPVISGGETESGSTTTGDVINESGEGEKTPSVPVKATGIRLNKDASGAIEINQYVLTDDPDESAAIKKSKTLTKVILKNLLIVEPVGASTKGVRFEIVENDGVTFGPFNVIGSADSGEAPSKSNATMLEASDDPDSFQTNLILHIGDTIKDSCVLKLVQNDKDNNYIDPANPGASGGSSGSTPKPIVLKPLPVLPSSVVAVEHFSAIDAEEVSLARDLTGTVWASEGRVGGASGPFMAFYFKSLTEVQVGRCHVSSSNAQKLAKGTGKTSAQSAAASGPYKWAKWTNEIFKDTAFYFYFPEKILDNYQNAGFRIVDDTKTMVYYTNVDTVAVGSFSTFNRVE